MLVSCNEDKSETTYCKKNKLIISKENLDKILILLTEDITNTFKGKWMFNPLLSDNVINFMKFIIVKDNTIEISTFNFE